MPSPASSLSSVPASSDTTPEYFPPDVRELFIGFFMVTISGFGGVLAWARRQFVQERRWMSPDDFNDLFALCQFLPGPNIVSFAAIHGWRLHRFAGVFAALGGLMIPPVILMILAGELYARFGTVPVFRGGLTGLAAAAAGLIIATSVQMAEPLARRDRLLQAALALIAFIAIGVLQWSLLPVLAVMAPISIAVAWRATPRQPAPESPPLENTQPPGTQEMHP
jgi:chromate transporter